MAHYNTTHEAGELLKEYESKAIKQEEMILRLFQTGKKMSPSIVMRFLGKDSKVPLTSVRRAIHNLTDEGKLVKTDLKVRGMFGRPEHIWEIV